MKNLISILAVASLLVITGACSSTQSSQSSADGVYYTPSENNGQASQSDQPPEKNYSKSDKGANNTEMNRTQTSDEEDGDYDYYNEDAVDNRNANQSTVINNYQNYQYTTRINRFNNPNNRFNYFDPFYSGYRNSYDPYYNRSGLSIRFSQRTGYYRDPFRRPYSRRFHTSPYRDYGYSHWRQPYDLRYRHGYRQGYRHGYNDGYYGYSPFYGYGGGYNNYYGGGYNTGGYYQDATNTSSGTTEQPRESISKNYRDQGNNSNNNNSRNPGRITNNEDPTDESSNNEASQSDYDYYEPKDNRSSDLNQRNRSPSYQRDRNNNSNNNSQDRYNNSRDNNRNSNRGRDNSYSSPDRNNQNNRERRSYDRNRGRDGGNSSDDNTNKPRR